MKIWVCIVMVFNFMVLNSLAFGEPTTNYPGTRARGMGGAYTAVSDDAAAIWYNPAGIAIYGENTSHDIILEGSQSIDIFDLEEGKLKPFAAYKYAGEKFGVALGYYVPFAYTDSADMGEAKELDIVSFALAKSFGQYLSIGAAAEWIILDKEAIAEGTGENDNGMSGTFGIQSTPLEYKPWGLQVRLGGTYRLNSSVSEEEYWRFEKPTSYNYGIAIFKSITQLKSSLLIAAQQEKTEFEDSDILSGENLKFENNSFGMEWQIITGAERFSHIALRCGYYQEETDQISDFDVTGITVGIGMKIGESWGLDYTFEKREWDIDDTSLDFKLHSAAITWSF